jgi:hypothetical protein
MALKFFDRTKQDATTTGTGTFTLATSASTGGFRTFASVHTTGDQVFYCAVDNVNNTFEVGEGTLTSGSPNWTLSRTVIKSSSNSNNVVNFGAAPEIFSTYPAENAAFSDTGLASNVVETDAIFTQTLTADKALSGQFKGTLQFNKAFFTSSDYTVASGQTLTVTDSADLYAVNISNTTVMDRTTDFTDVTAISADTLFAPGINAYAQVTINDGVTATVSPAGTTFVNNGSGIIVDSIQQEGGSTKWKLPLTDGSAESAIVTDGAGGFKVKGASAGGAVALNPQGETLLSTVDFNNYVGDINYVDFIVPTSLASNTSDIESFRIDLDFLTFYAPTGTDGANTAVFIQPMTAKDTRMSLGTAAWEWTSQYMYNNTTSYNRRTQYMTGDSNEGSSTTSNGTYYGKDYGLPLTGGSNNYGTPSDWYTDTSPNFTNSDPISQWHSNMTGTIKIQNQIYAPKVSFNFDGAMAYSSGQWNYTFMVTGGHSTYRQSSQTNNRPITGAHARGYRIWFLPVNYNMLSNWKISGGRLDAYVKLKQSKSQITVGDTA